MQPVLDRKFEGGVRLAAWGRSNNGHNFSAATGDYLVGVRAAEEYFGAPVHVLRVAFKNEGFVNFGKLDDLKDAEGKSQHEIVGELGSVRMIYQGDVGYMPVDSNNPKPVVIALLNADCPAVFALVHNMVGKVVGCFFAHGGLDCFLPKKIEDAANGISVLDTIRARCKELGLDHRLTKFYFGGGARRCCYGMDDMTSVYERLALRYGKLDADCITNQSVMRGPRRINSETGGVNKSINLEELFFCELFRVFGVYPQGLFQEMYGYCSVLETCTCCMDDGDSKLWSHIVHGGNDKTPLNPRNFTCFAWTP